MSRPVAKPVWVPVCDNCQQDLYCDEHGNWRHVSGNSIICGGDR